MYGAVFTQRVGALGMQQLIIAPRSPWQSPYVERLIGTVRRQCLDQLIILNAAVLVRETRKTTRLVTRVFIVSWDECANRFYGRQANRAAEMVKSGGPAAIPLWSCSRGRGEVDRAVPPGSGSWAPGRRPPTAPDMNKKAL
jgi:hypothetical protein